MPELTVEVVERFYAILAIVGIGFMRGPRPAADPGRQVGPGPRRVRRGRARGAGTRGHRRVASPPSRPSAACTSPRSRDPPCTLCWYQRIAMYLLVVIFGAAILRRSRSRAIRAPAGSAALAAIGAVIAAYHVALEWIPSLDTGACDVSAPCTLVWFRAGGVQPADVGADRFPPDPDTAPRPRPGRGRPME